MSEKEIIAQAITEAVCKQFMDWNGTPFDDASFGLKTDVYARVMEVLKNGVEV